MTKMKKLLFLFDTDPYASVFDTVVAYDGGADRVTGYANVTTDNVGALVDGTIYTRGGKDKQNTAIFVGGGDMPKGEALLAAVKKRFFGPFRVSIMLDSNGSNTTAAAAPLTLVAVSGEVHRLADTPQCRAVVAVFLSTECPISNGYLPELNRNAALPFQTGWLISGSTGGFRRGHLFRRMPDGEVYDLPFDDLPTDRDAVYDDLRDRLRDPRRSAAELRHDVLVATVIEAARRSADSGATQSL